MLVLMAGAWALLTTAVSVVGASTTPEDVPGFWAKVHDLVVLLAKQPTWVPATIFFILLAIFVAWYLWPGLRSWLDGADPEKVSSWTLSIEAGWGGVNGVGHHQNSPMSTLYYSRMFVKFVNVSTTQSRVVEVEDICNFVDAPKEYRRFHHPRSEENATPPSQISAIRPADNNQLFFPLTIPPNGHVEGFIQYVTPEYEQYRELGHSSALYVKELRSGKSMWIPSSMTYDAIQQRLYQGPIGQPLSWFRIMKIKLMNLRPAMKKRQSLPDIEAEKQL